MLGLLLVTAMAAGPGMAGPQLGTLGQPSPVVGLVDFTAGFGSASWYGAPSPTIDCTAAASGGDLTCTGATASKSGSPTTVGSPFWPTGWSGVQQGAVAGTGSEYYSLGNVGALTGDFTVCFQVNALSGYSFPIYFRRTGTEYGSDVYFGSNGALAVDVVKAGGGTTNATSATGVIPIGSWVTACVAYDYIADGSSTIKYNVGGTAGTMSTTAVGPPVDAATVTEIGRMRSWGNPYRGAIARVTVFADWAATPAEMDVAVKSQIGLLAAKPAGVALTHTRSDATLCGPYPDGLSYWLAPNVPCILPTSGVEVYGRAYNYLTYSQIGGSGWTNQNVVERTADSADVVGPLGNNTAAKLSLAACTDGFYRQARGAVGTLTGNTAYTYSGWLRTATGTAETYLYCYSGSKLGIKRITVTSAWQRFSTSFTTPASPGTVYCYIGTDMAPNGATTGMAATDALTVYVWQMQLAPGSYAVPLRTTTGSAYTGDAGSATTLSVPVNLTDPARWAVSWTGAAADWTPAALAGLWSFGAQGGGNTATSFISTNGAIAVDNLDPTTALQRLTASNPAWADGSSHTIHSAWAGAPWAEKLDGVATGGMTATNGSGMATFGSPLNLGSFGSANQLNGTISRVVQCKKASGCK